MFGFITRSIQAKLIAIMLVMFALLAVTIGLTFNTFSNLDGSAPAINQSGAQRMRIYKMATLANAFDRSRGEARVATGEDLRSTVAQFDAVQIGLDQGDVNFSLEGTNNKGILSQLAVVDEGWVSYRENVDTVLNSSDDDALALSRVNELATPFFNAVREARATIGSTGPNKAALDQGGAQRMRTYKMGFLANDFMSAQGAERAEIGAQLEATINEFEAVQIGLKSGDSNYGLVGTTIPEVRAQLEIVEENWVDYRSDLEMVLTNTGNSEAALVRVNNRATPMFSQVASARALIGSTGPNGAALDQGGAQRMRSFRMAFLANNLRAASGAEREQIGQELRAVIDEFAAVQAGLRSGDAGLGLKGSTIPEVLEKLSVVDTAWEVYRTDLEQVLLGSTVSMDALALIDSAAPVLFTESNSAVTLISDDSQGVVASLKQLEIILLIIGFVVFAAVVWFIRATIVKQLVQVTRTAEKVTNEELPRLISALKALATGDLSQSFDVSDERLQVKSSDEVGQIGQSFNELTDGLQESGNAFNEMIANLQERAEVANSIATGDLYVEFTPSSEKDVLGNAFLTMVNSLKERASVAEQIASGDLSVDTSNVDEKDVLGRAFAQMVTSLRGDTASVAEAIALGDLNVNTKSRSDNDVLGNAFVKMVETLKEKSAVADAIADGDLDVEIKIQSEDDVLGKAFIRMIENLKERAGLAEAIADGDLSVTAEPKSEKDVLGNAFSRMVVSLRSVIGKVAETADGMAEASDQLARASAEAGNATQAVAESSQGVSQGIEQQTEIVDQTTNAMGQLTQAIEQIAKGSQDQSEGVERASTIVSQVSKATEEVAQNAQSAADGSGLASEASRKGTEMVSKTVDGIGRIRDAVNEASTQISDLGEQSVEIGKIVAVIDDIAAQTNLLALNAAIEAARAGEQGRGFAVVADEVRGLAERVTEATKEIANLIDSIQKGVNESIKATEEGAREVAEGVELAEKAGEALADIMAAVGSVADQVQGISAGAEELNASGDEMVQTINSVSEIVEQNSAAAEEMSANSGEVAKSVEGISNISSQNSDSIQDVSASAEQMTAQVQEVVSSAQSLSEMAQDLQGVVASFNLNGRGNSEAGFQRGQRRSVSQGEEEEALETAGVAAD